MKFFWNLFSMDLLVSSFAFHGLSLKTMLLRCSCAPFSHHCRISSWKIFHVSSNYVSLKRRFSLVDHVVHDSRDANDIKRFQKIVLPLRPDLIFVPPPPPLYCSVRMVVPYTILLLWIVCDLLSAHECHLT